MSELYSLPKGWEWKKLEDLFTITSSKRVLKEDWLEKGIPFYRAREIVKLSQNGFVDNELFISEEMYNSFSKKYGLPKVNDILVTGVGTLGITYIVKENEKFYFKDGNIIWLKNDSNTNSKYIEYGFQTEFLKNQINSNSGSTVATYTITNANNTIIPIPPLEEQKRIVAKLDILFAKIDKAIALHQKNIDEANVFMASVLNNVFVELEEKYKYTKLKNAVTKEKTSIKRGPFGSALKKSFFVEKGYLVYEQYHALNNDFSMERYYIDENKFNELKGFEVKAGDIIISCSGAYLGKLAIIPNDFTKGIINQALLKLSLNKNIIINELFVYFWNNLMNNGFFDEVKKGAAIPNMPAVKELKEINIPLPELPIQQKVVSYLDEISQKMEKIKQIQKEKMQSLKALKASILDQAFKGEL